MVGVSAEVAAGGGVLVFSTQAAYAAPLLLLSQNRQAERDRIQAEHDFRVNHLPYNTFLPGTAMPTALAVAACDNSGPDTIRAGLADDLITESTAGVVTGVAQPQRGAP